MITKTICLSFTFLLFKKENTHSNLSIDKTQKPISPSLSLFLVASPVLWTNNQSTKPKTHAYTRRYEQCENMKFWSLILTQIPYGNNLAEDIKYGFQCCHQYYICLFFQFTLNIFQESEEIGHVNLLADDVCGISSPFAPMSMYVRPGVSLFAYGFATMKTTTKTHFLWGRETNR